jgi:phenylpropionate dioxygenase-like ring-hydroxylating dioxygenase large terminal subunit
VAGESIIVVRGTDGALRAMSNICRHRAGPVARDCGVVSRFQCAYHGWTYGLDGSLLGTPYFRNVPGFDRGDHCLPAFLVSTWGPFVFVNLDVQAPPLAETLKEVPQRFDRYISRDLVFHKRLVLEGAFNWKLLAENARECYHCAVVHPSFRAAYQIEDVVEESSDLWSLMYVPERSSAPSGELAELAAGGPEVIALQRESALGGLAETQLVGNYYVFLFPEWALGFQPDHIYARRTIPTAADRVTYVRDFFIPPTEEGKAEFERNWPFRLQTIQEDVAILEQVQRNLHSRHYDRSLPYSHKEQCVQDFHALMWRYLGGAVPASDA